MAHVLIVHAHPEARSFSSALAHTAHETLAAAGHEVTFTDLYRLGFDPVSDRRNFTTSADLAYFKQQQEEQYATAHAGFAPELETEIRKLESCDFLLFSFPLWWFGLPAILKGWVDRTFAYHRIYSREHWYETGIGRGKRAMAVITTGSPAASYNGRSLHPSFDHILAPIHHGMFWFNGFSPLPPFVAWSAAHGTDEDRHATLASWRERLAGVFEEPPLQLPLSADFDPETRIDRKHRFLATLTRTRPIDDTLRQLLPAEAARVQQLRREGSLLEAHLTPPEASPWRAFLIFRTDSAATVQALCQSLPLAAYLDFEITPLA